MINVTIIPTLKDNYAYLLKAPDGITAIVDPGEAKPVIRELEKQNLKLDFILNTHHHDDHIAGNTELKEKYGAKIAGPAAEKKRIPYMDILLNESASFMLGNEKSVILETPGHTAGHICFYFPESKILFTGDTLFLMGCGRLFEGTPEQMWSSFRKIEALPDETLIYCGHEYTLGNGRFCLKIEPENKALQGRMKNVENLRSQNLTTIPGSIAEEKKTNLFLRADTPARFAELRSLRNSA